MPLTFAETPLYYKDSQGNYHRILSGADMTGYRTAAAQDEIDAGKEASILGNLAMIESSPATQAHAVGDYIVWDGQLYKVTAAIAQGESLAAGTNVENCCFADSIGEYITENLATYSYATINISYNLTTKLAFLSVRGTNVGAPSNQAIAVYYPNCVRSKLSVLFVGLGGCMYVDARVSSASIAFSTAANAYCTAIFPIQ